MDFNKIAKARGAQYLCSVSIGGQHLVGVAEAGGFATYRVSSDDTLLFGYHRTNVYKMLDDLRMRAERIEFEVPQQHTEGVENGEGRENDILSGDASLSQAEGRS